jgi:hypothetical protein
MLFEDKTTFLCFTGRILRIKNDSPSTGPLFGRLQLVSGRCEDIALLTGYGSNPDTRHLSMTGDLGLKKSGG